MAGDLDFILRLTGGMGTDGIARRIGDLTPAMTKVGRKMKASVIEEFRRQVWKSPSGDRAWPAREAWGTRPIKNPPLGPVFTAWRNSTVVATPRRATVFAANVPTKGNSADSNTIIAYHRGGDGQALDPVRARTFKAVNTSTRGNFAMQVYNSANYKVHLTAERARRGFVVPTRRHGSIHPEIVEFARVQLTGHVAGDGDA